MSKILENMEKEVLSGRITDRDRIERITNDLLSMSFNGLADNVERYRFIAKDLANGFLLAPKKVAKLSIREILVLIGYEPGVPFFAVPEEDDWFYKDSPEREFYTAYNCLCLAYTLLNNKDSDIVKQFKRINLNSFRRYVKECAMGLLHKQGYTDPQIRAYGAGYNVKYGHLRWYLTEYCGIDEDADISIEELLRECVFNASRGWKCGIEPLDHYMHKTIKACVSMRILFMDFIRTNLIIADRNEFRAILDRCSESGHYDDENYAEIDFTDCYEGASHLQGS